MTKIGRHFTSIDNLWNGLQPGQETTAPEDESNIWAHCLVMWGNLLYEYSQMQAAVGLEWKASLDSATDKFRTAGCPEADIRSALKSHTMKDEIDLGPEPVKVRYSQLSPFF